MFTCHLPNGVKIECGGANEALDLANAISSNGTVHWVQPSGTQPALTGKTAKKKGTARPQQLAAASLGRQKMTRIRSLVRENIQANPLRKNESFYKRMAKMKLLGAFNNLG